MDGTYIFSLNAHVIRAYSDRTPCTSGSNNCWEQLIDDPRFSDMIEFEYFRSWGDINIEAELSRIVQEFVGGM